MKKIGILIGCLFCLSCTPNNDKPLSGYIEGEYTYISSNMGGTLLNLYVHRGQVIQQNTLLFQLDPEPNQSTMEAAKALAEQLQTEVALAKVQLARYQDLYAHHATDKATLDEKQTDFDSKTKRLQNALKNWKETQWAFQQKTVYAPIGGTVFDTFYRVGENVNPTQPVLAILAPKNIKILFYIPEKKRSTLKLGQTIRFHCDGCPTETKATITYISPEAEYTPPVIYSQDTRYQLVYLVRADMLETIATQFHPGQPVDIFLHE